jgi:hypothetical protein
LTENQFNDDAWLWNSINPPSGLTLNTLLSYAWITSDKWGTLNWGLLSPATDNVGLLPDLSGTILEENAVLFVGFGMFVRPSGATGALGQLRWTDRRGIIDAANADGLQTSWTPYDFANHACALVGGQEPAMSETGHMQENVGKV